MTQITRIVGTLGLLISVFSFPFSAFPQNLPRANQVRTSTTGFGGNISTTDTNVQLALDRLDNLSIPSAFVGSNSTTVTWVQLSPGVWQASAASAFAVSNSISVTWVEISPGVWQATSAGGGGTTNMWTMNGSGALTNDSFDVAPGIGLTGVLTNFNGYPRLHLRADTSLLLTGGAPVSALNNDAGYVTAGITSGLPTTADITVTNAASVHSAGVPVYKQLVNKVLQFLGIAAGTGMTVSTNATDLTLAVDGTVMRTGSFFVVGGTFTPSAGGGTLTVLGSITLTNTGSGAGIVNGSGATWGVGTAQTASAGGITNGQIGVTLNGGLTGTSDLGYGMAGGILTSVPPNGIIFGVNGVTTGVVTTATGLSLFVNDMGFITTGLAGQTLSQYDILIGRTGVVVMAGGGRTAMNIDRVYWNPIGVWVATNHVRVMRTGAYLSGYAQSIKPANAGSFNAFSIVAPGLSVDFGVDYGWGGGIALAPISSVVLLTSNSSYYTSTGPSSASGATNSLFRQWLIYLGDGAE